MSTEIGFCLKCHIIRENDKFGPVTPCACFVEHHDRECRLRIAVRSLVAITCEEHRKDSCLTCFSCTCGVAAERMFVCGASHFTWEPDAGLVPSRRKGATSP